jgi:solute carrier family 8 (sodium/calcium exchanger)
MPDTFASKQAATAEKTADSSIGNINGSNAVNVFLGLGIPWVLASFYWKAKDVSFVACSLC